MRRRNAEIDLLKFIFCAVIVLHHANIPYFPVRGGYLAVEFFFSVTGVYLWRMFENNCGERKSIAFADTNKYVLTRITKIYPYYLLSCLLSLAVHIIAEKWSVSTLIGNLLFLPSDLFFLQSFGFPSLSLTGTMWYLCALFFALWVLHYILLKASRKSIERYFLVIPLLAIGAILRVYKSFNVPHELFVGFIDTGLLRAVSIIMLGIWVSSKASSIKVRNCFWIQIVKAMLYAFCLGYVFCFQEGWGAADGTFIIAIVIAVALSVHYPMALNDSKVVIYFGRLSTVLFMNHFYWLNELPKIYTFQNKNLGTVLAICVSIISSMIILLIGDKFVRFYRFRKNEKVGY